MSRVPRRSQDPTLQSKGRGEVGESAASNACVCGQRLRRMRSDVGHYQDERATGGTSCYCRATDDAIFFTIAMTSLRSLSFRLDE